MSYRCLADFLEELGNCGELLRVEVEVDPLLELAEITRRTSAIGGKALLFGSVSGHDVPVLTNLLGSRTRICRALKCNSPDDVAERISQLANPTEPEGWFEKLKTAPHLAALSSLAPRRVKSGAVQQIVRLGSDVDLGELPVLQSAPAEAGRAITAAVVVTADPDSHELVAGRWDLQVLDDQRLAVCWAEYDEPARLLAEYGRRAEKMPVAAVLGGDPALLLAASASPAPAVDAYAVAGMLREKPLDVVGCRSVDLAVPAEAEIVVEGYVDPAQPPVEAGPLCAPLGHYRPALPAPVVQVTAITHRANPVYPAVVFGNPPHEGCEIHQALARIFLPLVRMAIPELVDYDLPAFGAGRHFAAVSIQKTYAGQARRVAHAAWGLRQMMFAKILVVVDEEVDVRDAEAVLGAISRNVHPLRDVFTRAGPADPLDAAACGGELGHTLGIDATAKLPGEHPRPWPQPAVVGDEIRRLVEDRWEQYGLRSE